jgi:branched-chain amino acid transport system substrate-binding protein
MTSVQASVATDLQAGMQLAFLRSKERGMEIVPEWEDDRSEPDRTAKAVELFAKDDSFLATSGIVGTPHAIKALPVASRAGLPVVGLRSGAAELRDGRQGVYHLRASYNDELARMVSLAAGAGLTQVAVVYSDDAFGRGAFQHVQAIAPRYKLQIVATAAAERNGSNVQQMVTSVIVGQGAKPLALLMLMIAEPMERGVRHARESLLFPYPIFAMSFCATRALAESRAPYLVGLGLVSAFPLPRVDVSGLALDFMRLAAAYKPGTELSLTSYEGFLYGATLSQALARAKEPTRLGLQQALRVPLSVGGYRVTFDDLNVGYRYLQTIHKSYAGVLRA